MDSDKIRATVITKPTLRYVIALFLLIFGKIYYGAELAVVHPILFILFDFLGERLARERKSGKLFVISRLGSIFLAITLPVVFTLVSSIVEIASCKRSPNCQVVHVQVAEPK